MCKRIFVTMLMLVVFGMMQADAQQLNYQAIARNANGVALTFRDVGIRLSIRDGSPNGSIVFSESRNIRTNQFGLFTVVIGSPGASNVLGSMASINWISGNKYLQVEIDPEGGTNYFQAGTSQLQAVPYALFANAAYPVGPAGGDLLGSTYPNPIIAPLAVTTGKIANQAITTPKIADLNVTTPKLADQAVTNAKIQDNTIANIKLVNSRVTLNGLILNLGDAQDFAIGTNGIDVNIVSAGNTHTFNFPDASIANRGLITPNAQTIGGNKTFNNDITAARIIRAGGLAAQFLKADGSVDNNIYLTENQPIIVTATGDATGVSTSSRTAPVLPLTLATVNSAVGTYGTNIVVPSITVNNKGLVTNVVANPIPTATAITSGLLTVGDWNIFNNKQNAIPLGSAAQYFRGDLTLSNFQTDVRNELSAGTNITYANGTFSNAAPMVYPGSGIALSNGNSWVGSITDNSNNWNTAFTDRFKWDGGASGLVPSTGRTSLGGTTVGSNFFTLTNPSAISFPRMNADNTVTALSAADFRTAIGAGTVTSVNISVPTGLTVGGGPITSSGTINLGLATGYSIPTDAIQANWTTAFNERLRWDGSATGLIPATGRTSLGGTTVGSNFFTLTNPSAISFPRMNADNTVTALSAADFRTAIGAGTSSTNGTVTSVDFTVPTGLTIGGGPITSAGTLALGLAPGYSIPTDAIQANWTTAFNERLRWDGSATGLIPATGRTSLGGTTVGSNFFTLTNPSAISFPRMNADNTVTALSAADFRTAIGAGTSSTNGTVTSVDFTVPTGLTIGGGPITTSGTLALGLAPGYSIPTDAIQANWTTAFTQTRQWDGGATGLVQATGRTSLGGTTVGSNYFTLTNPNAISFPRMNADNTITALSAADFRTAIGVTGSSNAWSTEGNNGLSATTNFIGTTDAVALRFRVNNTFSGQIHPTSTVGNTSFGFETNSTTAANSYNSAFGSQALKANTNSGVRNSAFGALALTNNTSGEDNTGIGQGALVANLTGNNNTGVGQGALAFNSTGSSNTALGQAALNTNTTTSNNTAVGRSALFASTGSNNTGIGHFALLANTTGSANTAVGQNSLSANTTTSNNTALGWEALKNTTNSGNVGIGYNAGVNATFSNSISIGLNANVGSDNGIAIGAPATVGAASGNSIAIGLSASTTAQQSIAIGSSSVGGGTAAIAIGQTASATGLNAVAIGNGASNAVDNSITLGGATNTIVRTTGSMNAGKFIGNSSGTSLTHVSGIIDNATPPTLSGNDVTGFITFTTGAVPAGTGNFITVNFGTSYAGGNPVVIIQPVSNTAPRGLATSIYCLPSATTTGSFIISTGAALLASTEYQIAYHVIGRQ